MKYVDTSIYFTVSDLYFSKHFRFLTFTCCYLQSEETDCSQEKAEPKSPEEIELRRYGYWSPEANALNLPSYRAAYLFLCRIPLDLVHEFLRLRLETKPERPSSMSIRQVRIKKVNVC